MKLSDINQPKQIINEAGGQGNISNPLLTKAYGTETFSDLFNKLHEDIPVIMKKVTGWFIDKDDKKMPLKLVSKKDAIIGVGLSGGGRLTVFSSRAIFKINDLGKKS